MENLPIAIGYKKVFGLLLLSCALFIIGVALFLGQLFPQIITGGICFLASIMYLTQPALVVARRSVDKKNLFGATIKSYPLESLKYLAVDDSGLRVHGERVKVARWLLSSGDFERVKKAIAEAA
jgi:hypothetical protein